MSFIDSLFGGGQSSSVDLVSVATNPIAAAGAASAIGEGAFAAAFTAAGVSPSFFSQFGFLDFLDNSTGKWKSRSAKFASWTPNQRIAWYINEIRTKGEIHDASQYSEMYGRRADQIDDQRTVDYSLAKIFNDSIEEKFWHGNEIAMDGPWPLGRNGVFCDLSLAANKPSPIIQMLDSAGTKKAGFSGLGLLLLLGLAVGLLFSYDFKNKKFKKWIK